jgi:hypothetical protein
MRSGMVARSARSSASGVTPRRAEVAARPAAISRRSNETSVS